jgi:hypothetical protein
MILFIFSLFMVYLTTLSAAQTIYVYVYKHTYMYIHRYALIYIYVYLRIYRYIYCIYVCVYVNFQTFAVVHIFLQFSFVVTVTTVTTLMTGQIVVPKRWFKF